MGGFLSQITGRADTSGCYMNIVGSFADKFTPMEKAVIHNQTLPTANTNWLESDLVPTNAPCLFRIMVSVTNPGRFSVVITRGGNTQVSAFNNNASITSDAVNIFDIIVHSGDTINFRYSTGTGTIQFLRVQEIDAATQ